MNIINNAEGGTDGVTVTTGNSGNLSGTAFSAVGIGTGSALTFTNTVVHDGILAYAVSPGSSANSYVELTPPATMPFIFAQTFVYFTSTPTAAFQLMRFTNTSGVVMANLILTGTSKFAVQNYVGTISGSTSTVSVPTNEWLCCELTVAKSTDGTDGYCLLNIYQAGSTTPYYTFTTNSMDTTTLDAKRFQAGKITNAGDLTTFYMDDILIQDISPLSVAWFTA